MRGNSHVRFLGGCGPVTGRTYPTPWPPQPSRRTWLGTAVSRVILRGVARIVRGVHRGILSSCYPTIDRRQGKPNGEPLSLRFSPHCHLVWRTILLSPLPSFRRLPVSMEMDWFQFVFNMLLINSLSHTLRKYYSCGINSRA